VSSSRPFLLVNAGSGGGRTQESIVSTAKELGLDHHVAKPGDDFGAVLASALEHGADVLAAAGGDGTLCAVANVAMDHDLPMIVVPAGTRNHFALDVGLDLDNPTGVLRGSLTSGHERRIDVGVVNGTTFLNNASLGVYAAAVDRSDYRDHKVKAFVGAFLEADSRKDRGQARLTLAAPGSAAADLGEGTSALMVVNNAYAPGFSPGRRLRPRLDDGLVWVYAGGGQDLDDSGPRAMIRAASSALSTSLLRVAFGTEQITIAADRPDVPIAVDGEDRHDLTAPFEFSSRTGALRLLVPSDPAPHDVDVLLSW
jgi:diacylglycerol kinase family enzyme